MTNSGFQLVAETAVADPIVAKGAGEPLFTTIPSQTITSIQGDGNATNTVTVETAVATALAVGDKITISGVPTQTAYNLDVNVAITLINSTTEFEYETTNHTNATEDTGGGLVSVPDNFVVPSDISDELALFYHLSLGTDTLSIVQITKNGTDYVDLGNGETLIGEIFKSFPVQKGDVLNARLTTAATVFYGRLLREP